MGYGDCQVCYCYRANNDRLTLEMCIFCLGFKYKVHQKASIGTKPRTWAVRLSSNTVQNALRETSGR
jgi:hypothetical protein